MFLIYFHKYVLQGTSGLEGEFKSGSEEASPGCVRVQVVLVMEDVALVSLTPTASVMFIREEGLASLQLGQMGGMDVDTGNSDLFDIHRIGHPGNFLDLQVLVNNFLSRIKRHMSQIQSLLLSSRLQVDRGEENSIR